MAKADQDDRAVDAGLVNAKGKTDAELLEWWKQRMAQIAAVPGEVARTGALLPMLRQLSRLPPEERRRLTKARLRAFPSLSSEQQEAILAARRLGNGTDPELMKSDNAVVAECRGEIPGVDDYLKRSQA